MEKRSENAEAEAYFQHGEEAYFNGRRPGEDGCHDRSEVMGPTALYLGVLLPARLWRD